MSAACRRDTRSSVFANIGAACARVEATSSRSAGTSTVQAGMPGIGRAGISATARQAASGSESRRVDTSAHSGSRGWS